MTSDLDFLFFFFLLGLLRLYYIHGLDVPPRPPSLFTDVYHLSIL